MESGLIWLPSRLTQPPERWDHSTTSIFASSLECGSLCHLRWFRCSAKWHNAHSYSCQPPLTPKLFFHNRSLETSKSAFPPLPIPNWVVLPTPHPCRPHSGSWELAGLALLWLTYFPRRDVFRTHPGLACVRILRLNHISVPSVTLCYPSIHWCVHRPWLWLTGHKDNKSVCAPVTAQLLSGLGVQNQKEACWVIRPFYSQASEHRPCCVPQ